MAFWRLEVKFEGVPEAEKDYNTLEAALELAEWIIYYGAAIMLIGWVQEGPYKWEQDCPGGLVELKISEMS